MTTEVTTQEFLDHVIPTLFEAAQEARDIDEQDVADVLHRAVHWICEQHPQIGIPFYRQAVEHAFGEIGELKPENERLAGEVNGLRCELDDLKKQQHRLEGNLTTAKVARSGLENDLESARKKIAKLEKFKAKAEGAGDDETCEDVDAVFDKLVGKPRRGRPTNAERAARAAGNGTPPVGEA
jgi:hypothetical protein